MQDKLLNHLCLEMFISRLDLILKKRIQKIAELGDVEWHQLDLLRREGTKTHHMLLFLQQLQDLLQRLQLYSILQHQ